MLTPSVLIFQAIDFAPSATAWRRGLVAASTGAQAGMATASASTAKILRMGLLLEDLQHVLEGFFVVHDGQLLQRGLAQRLVGLLLREVDQRPGVALEEERLDDGLLRLHVRVARGVEREQRRAGLRADEAQLADGFPAQLRVLLAAREVAQALAVVADEEA